MKFRFFTLIRSVFLSAGALLPAAVWAQTDSLSIDSTTVVAERPSSLLRSLSPQSARIQTDQLKSLPSILGNADPLHFAQLLPSMQTTSEIDAGIHIQGSENSHNYLSLGGVPIYGATHLLGLFSVFNPAHFETLSYTTAASDVNRLGGALDLSLPAQRPEAPEAEASLGLISLQGTLRLPLSPHSALFVSGRRSFLNLLYGSFLRFDGNEFQYGFGDGNLTWLWTPTAQDKLWADFYYGSDRVSFPAELLSLDTRGRWHNASGALHWKHGSWSQSLYITQFALSLTISQERLKMSLPSAMRTFGYKAAFSRGRWHAGVDVARHEARPQRPEVSGSFVNLSPPQERQQATEATALVRYSRAFGPWETEATLKGHSYLSPEKKWLWGLSPAAALSLNLYRGGLLRVHYGWQRQYLFQTGVTNLGFPCEFWFLAGACSKPQLAQAVSLSYRADLLHGRLRLSAETYYRKLFHQVEYKGDLLDLLRTAYSLEEHLLKGEGRAYGLNLMLHKQTGALTGWIGYAWGRSLRSFDHPLYPAEYPAAHERIHEFNAVATYRTGKWDLGGTLTAASGTPFTAPDAFYILSNQLVSHYGAHHANRLKPYFRLDVSVTRYLWKTERRECGLTLSVYNATFQQNDLYYRLKIKSSGAFAYTPLHLPVSGLPTLSCFVKL